MKRDGASLIGNPFATRATGATAPTGATRATVATLPTPATGATGATSKRDHRRAGHRNVTIGWTAADVANLEQLRRQTIVAGHDLTRGELLAAAVRVALRVGLDLDEAQALDTD